jgi:tetratricopeptide (TPR) repeat protein
MKQETISSRMQRAVGFHNQGQLDQAEQIYEAILTEDPDQFYALNFLGCIKRIKGDHEKGIDLLVKAVSLQPNNPDVHYNLGNIFKDLRRWNDAIACYEKSLGLNPQLVEALNNLGICFLEVAYYERSEFTMKKVISLQPGFVGAWLNLANALRSQQKYSEAISSALQAISLKPDKVESFVLLSSLYKQQGDINEAITCLMRVIALQPDYAQSYFSLGMIYQELQYIDEAISAYSKATELKPDYADVWSCLGSIYKQEGNVEKAISCYQKVINLIPHSAEAYKDLASIFHEEHNLNQALELYSLALQKDPHISDCHFHLCAAGLEEINTVFQRFQVEISSVADSDLLSEDLFFVQLFYDFVHRRGWPFTLPKSLLKKYSIQDLKTQCSRTLAKLISSYRQCRQSSLPRWLRFPGIPCEMQFLAVSDYLESQRVDSSSLDRAWHDLKDYQLSFMSASSKDMPPQSVVFSRLSDCNESLWMVSQAFQFPDVLSFLSLQASLEYQKAALSTSKLDQSEFFRKTHLLDAQKFYMAEEDPCLHGVSELYRVHGLIADTIREMECLQSVVDLGYYSCGIFNAGLRSDIKRYCIEPARHHAVWAAESGIAEVVPDVPERCVRSFEEYLSRLDAVALDDPASTAAVISFILQLFEYEQCIEILQRVKGFASRLVITDDILNEESDESILRLLSNGKRMNLCHNYQRLLLDAGWQVKKKWYCHGVRYASGIIVARAA